MLVRCFCSKAQLPKQQVHPDFMVKRTHALRLWMQSSPLLHFLKSPSDDHLSCAAEFAFGSISPASPAPSCHPFLCVSNRCFFVAGAFDALCISSFSVLFSSPSCSPLLCCVFLWRKTGTKRNTQTATCTTTRSNALWNGEIHLLKLRCGSCFKCICFWSYGSHLKRKLEQHSQSIKTIKNITAIKQVSKHINPNEA